MINLMCLKKAVMTKLVRIGEVITYLKMLRVLKHWTLSWIIGIID